MHFHTVPHYLPAHSACVYSHWEGGYLHTMSPTMHMDYLHRRTQLIWTWLKHTDNERPKAHRYTHKLRRTWSVKGIVGAPREFPVRGGKVHITGSCLDTNVSGMTTCTWRSSSAGVQEIIKRRWRMRRGNDITSGKKEVWKVEQWALPCEKNSFWDKALRKYF